MAEDQLALQAAITLCSQGFRTVIVEHSGYRASRIGETLPPAIRNLLVTLGVWQSFLTEGHIESFAIRLAWGDPRPFETNHLYNPYGSGWHVDRVKFDRMLAATAANRGSILLTETHIKSISEDQEFGWEVEILQQNQCIGIRAPFLIDATGRLSANPIRLPRSFNVVDRLIGIIYIYSFASEPYTLIEAESCGWWYSAPLPNGSLIVSHMTDADLFASSNHNVNEYWPRHLSKATLTHARTANGSQVIGPKVVSAASLIRRTHCGRNWLAIGESCVAFDPLSGRGVYKAMESGILAAEAIIAWFEGKHESINKYTDWVTSQFSIYLHERRIIYNKEQRWSHSTFWSRRHEKPFQISIQKNSL